MQILYKRNLRFLLFSRQKKCLGAKQKKYQLQKQEKKNSTSNGKYTKIKIKSTLNGKHTKIETKTVTPSSSCSSTNSSKGLLSKNNFPRQVAKRKKL